MGLALIGLLFHGNAIALRCMIAGRPPVTNMYESIIWVSFAVLFFGMIFFARYRAPVYLLAALPVSLRGPASRPSNTNRDAVEHRSARAGPAR